MVRRKRESESKIQAEMVNRETKLFLMDTEAQLAVAELNHNRAKLEIQHRHQIDRDKSNAEIAKLQCEQANAQQVIAERHNLELSKIANEQQKLKTEADAYHYTSLLAVDGITEQFLLQQMHAESFRTIVTHNKSVIVPYDAAKFLGAQQILASTNVGQMTSS